MSWAFDEDALRTAASWWDGGSPAAWRNGSWRCAGSSGYDLLVVPEADRITVWDGILQDNVEGVGPLVICHDADVALKCLLFATGVRERQRRGLDRLLIPHSPELARAGFVLSRRTDGPPRSEVSWQDGEDTCSARFGWPGDAVEFTFYARASLDELKSSLLSPDGGPLFSGVRRVPAGSSEHARP